MSKTGAKPNVWVIAGLVLCALAIYGQTGGFGFINFDDDLYVYENPMVRAGLTWAGLKWALTAVVSSNWMPVTLLSHMLDVQLFGVRSGPQHLVSAAIHALSGVVLYLFLVRATRALWPSAFVAFAFVAHPLHVESVAWIAERKDVLSALFWFAGLYAYVRYAERPGRGRYLAVAGLFALGLMAKPMVVTFPFTLMLLDVWPLRRFRWPGTVVEKLPLVALSALASGVSYGVQSSSGAVMAIPAAMRVENALISVVTYVGQFVWPAGLAVFYPYGRSVEGWQAAGALVLIAGGCWVAIGQRDRRPWLGVGWFWFLGTLVPVIGLVQVGNQAHADRYTYVPMLGLTVMVAWGAAEAVKMRRWVVGAAVAVGAVWVALAWRQAGYWENNQTLYTHAIAETRENWLAEYNLGEYLMDQPNGNAEAIPHFEAVLRVLPNHAESHNNLGSCLMKTGRNEEAAEQFEAALRSKPDFADADYNLGRDLLGMPGRAAEAEASLRAAVRLAPDNELAHNALAYLLMTTGRAAEAIPHYEAVLRLDPGPQAEHNLGAALATTPGRQAEAIAHFEAEMRLRPDPQTARLIELLRGQK